MTFMPTPDCKSIILLQAAAQGNAAIDIHYPKYIAGSPLQCPFQLHTQY